MKKNNVLANHVQIGGLAFYNQNCFSFSPDDAFPGRVEKFKSMGIAQQLSDGSFDFEPRPRKRSQAELILKLAHGRVSKTKDGAILLTLKVDCNEGINIADAISRESFEATDAIKNFQLKR